MTPASASDSENGSVSSWNSTSDNGGNSPLRDNSEDSSEETGSQSRAARESEQKLSKRPRLESSSLMAISHSIHPEKRTCK